MSALACLGACALQYTCLLLCVLSAKRRHGNILTNRYKIIHQSQGRLWKSIYHCEELWHACTALKANAMTQKEHTWTPFFGRSEWKHSGILLSISTILKWKIYNFRMQPLTFNSVFSHVTLLLHARFVYVNFTNDNVPTCDTFSPRTQSEYDLTWALEKYSQCSVFETLELNQWGMGSLVHWWTAASVP